MTTENVYQYCLTVCFESFLHVFFFLLPHIHYHRYHLSEMPSINLSYSTLNVVNQWNEKEVAKGMLQWTKGKFLKRQGWKGGKPFNWIFIPWLIFFLFEVILIFNFETNFQTFGSNFKIDVFRKGLDPLKPLQN